MPTYTSNETSPTGVAQRVQELEAVLKYVLDKLSDLTAPQGPDGEKLARIYDLVNRGARSDNTSSDPYAETIYDTAHSSVSMSTFGVIDSGNIDRMQLIMSGRPLIAAVFPRDEDRYFATSMTLSSVTMGPGDYATRIYSASTSMAQVTFGNVNMMSALIDAGGLATTILETPSYVTAFGSRALVDILFGSSTRAAAWASGLSNFATAAFGSTVPGITAEPLIDRIANLERRMGSAEGRLSSGGL